MIDNYLLKVKQTSNSRKKTTIKKIRTANQPKLKGIQSEMTGMTKTTVTTTRGGAASTGSSMVNERTTITTDTAKTAQKETPTTVSAKNDKIVETIMIRRNDGTGSKN